MSDLNTLFRRKIRFQKDEPISFHHLSLVLAKLAVSVPFENFRIIENKTEPISRSCLVNKILIHNEGGLCYELNALLYFFLIENGFKAELTRGVVYHGESQSYVSLGRTHVTILLYEKDQTYLIDTGFGGNLPLQPVPLNGDTIYSSNGQFRVKPVDHELGDYVFEMRLKHKDTDWKIGYTFHSDQPISGMSECDDVQRIIAQHPDSPFNKGRLITRLTENGNITLTESTVTEWSDGTVRKEPIDIPAYKELLLRHFGR